MSLYKHKYNGKKNPNKYILDESSYNDTESEQRGQQLF